MTRATPRPWRLRPAPADFADLAPAMKMADLAKHYSVGWDVLRRWVKEIGGRRQHQRSPVLLPVPADFTRFAEVESNRELGARYNRGAKTIARWRREGGVECRRSSGAQPAPVPDGFALVAANLTMKELRDRYGRSAMTIRRWCAEAGVEPRKVGRAHAALPGRPVVSAADRRFTPQTRVRRDASRAGMAADYLRRFGPVFRCTSEGKQAANGTHWNRGGRTILTDAELIERAMRNGWAPDAWREMAA